MSSEKNLRDRAVPTVLVSQQHYDELQASIQRIRDLHHMKEEADTNGIIHKMCNECDVDDWFIRYEPWPCLTIRILDGIND